MNMDTEEAQFTHDQSKEQIVDLPIAVSEPNEKNRMEYDRDDVKSPLIFDLSSIPKQNESTLNSSLQIDKSFEFLSHVSNKGDQVQIKRKASQNSQKSKGSINAKKAQLAAQFVQQPTSGFA